MTMKAIAALLYNFLEFLIKAGSTLFGSCFGYIGSFHYGEALFGQQILNII